MTLIRPARSSWVTELVLTIRRRPQRQGRPNSSSGASTTDAASHRLFAVTFSTAAPDAKFSQVRHPPTGMDILGADADYLLTEVLNPVTNPLVLMCPLPEGRYDLRTDFADVPDSVTSSAIQQAILAGLHLQALPRTVTKGAYILKATDTSNKVISPTVSTGKQIRGYWNGALRIMNGTMDDLAYERRHFGHYHSKLTGLKIAQRYSSDLLLGAGRRNALQPQIEC